MINQSDPRAASAAQARETVNPGMADATMRSYAEGQHTTDVDPTGRQSENRVTVSQDKNLGRVQRRFWIVNALFFLLGMLEMTLALRFVLRLLGASQGSSFTLFPYSLGHVLVAPLNGIFHDQALGARSVFELSPLIAMLLFALLAWGLVAMGRVVVFAPGQSSRQR
jgi:hypothetical protein